MRSKLRFALGALALVAGLLGCAQARISVPLGGLGHIGVIIAPGGQVSGQVGVGIGSGGVGVGVDIPITGE